MDGHQLRFGEVIILLHWFYILLVLPILEALRAVGTPRSPNDENSSRRWGGEDPSSSGATGEPCKNFSFFSFGISVTLWVLCLTTILIVTDIVCLEFILKPAEAEINK